MEDYPRATREPFLNVHFAGTETAANWQGFMEGAVESGERVANEVIYALVGDESLKSGAVDYEKTFYNQRARISSLIANREENSTAHASCLKIF